VAQAALFSSSLDCDELNRSVNAHFLSCSKDVAEVDMFDALAQQAECAAETDVFHRGIDYEQGNMAEPRRDIRR
jgi:hypothetical protein